MIKLLEAIKILIDVAKMTSADWGQGQYKDLADQILALASRITGKPVPQYPTQEAIVEALLIIIAVGINAARDYQDHDYAALAQDIVALAEKLAALIPAKASVT